MPDEPQMIRDLQPERGGTRSPSRRPASSELAEPSRPDQSSVERSDPRTSSTRRTRRSSRTRPRCLRGRGRRSPRRCCPTMIRLTIVLDEHDRVGDGLDDLVADLGRADRIVVQKEGVHRSSYEVECPLGAPTLTGSPLGDRAAWRRRPRTFRSGRRTRPARPRLPPLGIHRVGEMLRRAGAARCDHGDRHRIGDRPGQLQVVPSVVPSRSIDVSRISPAPSAHASSAHPPRRAPWPCGPPRRRPPSDRHRRSPAEHRSPRLSLELRTRPQQAGSEPGVHGGGVDRRPCRLRLAARRATSSTADTPPPTVRGMKTVSAVRATTSRIVPRFSCDAVMSRKTISSASSAS